MRRYLYISMGLALSVFANPSFAYMPTAETLSYLGELQTTHRRAVITGDRLGVLHGTVLASDASSSTTTDDFVESFLAANKDAFGVSGVELELVGTRDIRNGKFRTYTYWQVIEDLPVEHSSAGWHG